VSEVVLSRRAGKACLVVILAIVVYAATSAAAQAQTIGYRGASVTGTGTQVTGAKPESKLWFNDGHWWAIMWDEVEGDNFIYRLDPIAQRWVNTGTVTDNRSGTRSDVLWDGTKLYVASHSYTNTAQATASGARLYRFSYSATTDRYTRDSGFPVSINDWRTESLVIAKDSTGKLWATWNQGTEIYVTRTLTSDASWGAPFRLPLANAAGITTDDISSVLAFGGNKIGVMWSDQTRAAMHFAVHVDGAAAGTWTQETAISGPLSADDHINMKADGSGRVFAATKTSAVDATAPQIYLLVRSSTGTWTRHVAGLKSDHHTRPIVVLDTTNSIAHVFATSGEEGGTIYQKKVEMNNIAFEPGLGTPVLRDAASADMNDVTSTKQNVTAATGLVIHGSDDTSRFYWHNTVPLTPLPLDADFTGTPTRGAAPLAVTFTDRSRGAPTSWLWAFGDGTTSTLKNPSKTYSAPGTYTVELTAWNAGGQTNVETKTNYVTAEPLAAEFLGSPTSGAAPLAVSFTDQSTGNPVMWSWSFGDGTTSALRNPSKTYANPGTYTVTLTVSGSNGVASTKTRVDYVSALPLTAEFSGSPTFGTAPLVVSFTDTSVGTPTTWAWDFGDGGTSTLGNPTHTYTDEGVYTVRLTVTDALGQTSTKTKVDFVTATPDALFTSSEDTYVNSSSPDRNFGATGTLRVRSGLLAPPDYVSYVRFNVTGLADDVTAAKLRLHVTDGGNDGGDVYAVSDPWTETGLTWQNAPVATGPKLADVPGGDVGQVVEVSLPASAFAAGNQTYAFVIKSDNSQGGAVWFSSREGVAAPRLALRTIPLPLDADFAATPTSGGAPLAVSFSDNSQGEPTSWLWDFGDGRTSTERNPSHTYSTIGPYTVSLTVSDGRGDVRTRTRANYISVEPLAAEFTGTARTGPAPLAVSFTDASTGSPASWLWDFGDGTSSTERNPSHTYVEAGTYTVSLTVTDANGESSTWTEPNYVTALPLTADFTASPSFGSAPLVVTFTDRSIGTPTTWFWDFGDGTTSAAQTPTHTYELVGTYTVRLTITDAKGETSTKTRMNYVTASGSRVFAAGVDSFVSSNEPARNFGTASSVRVRSGAASPPHYVSYVKFAVAGLVGGPTDVKLRLLVTDAANEGGKVYLVDNAWTESTLTWDNAPLVGTTSLVTIPGGNVGDWLEVTLPASAFAGGDGTYSLAIKSDNPNAGAIWYSSREGTSAPQLVVSVG